MRKRRNAVTAGTRRAVRPGTAMDPAGAGRATDGSTARIDESQLAPEPEGPIQECGWKHGDAAAGKRGTKEAVMGRREQRERTFLRRASPSRRCGQRTKAPFPLSPQITERFGIGLGFARKNFFQVREKLLCTPLRALDRCRTAPKTTGYQGKGGKRKRNLKTET